MLGKSMWGVNVTCVVKNTLQVKHTLVEFLKIPKSVK